MIFENTEAIAYDHPFALLDIRGEIMNDYVNSRM